MGNNYTFLTSKDVAHLLDCSPDDVAQLAKRGDLEARKKGRFWRFRPEDVTDYKSQVEQKTSLRSY